MMALNIAVPLTTVGDLMDGFGLLSPISPLSVDCRSVVAAAGTHGKKQLVSPVGSESSGVSSLDSDEIKKPTSPPTTPTEEVERPTASSPLPATAQTDTTIVQQQDSISGTDSSSSGTSSARSSLSSCSSDSSSSEQGSTGTEALTDNLSPASPGTSSLPELPPKELKLVVGGRNVLDLMDNLTAPNHFRLQFAQLPENDNIHFFLDNRSQYHRLGANGHIQEYTMVSCKRCDFRYPVNGTSITSGGPMATMGQSSLAAAFQQLPGPGFTNNLNSIVNSRDKMNLNAAANAFSKTFGGGSQYFRNGNAMAAGPFGRDSNNRNSGGNNFLNSTGTYNNQKTYQQQQSMSGNKFNAAPFGSYQQQQQFFSKNHQMRYGSATGNGQPSGSMGGFNAVAAAAALANFNSFGGKNSNNNNNNNMFAYYKTMM